MGAFSRNSYKFQSSDNLVIGSYCLQNPSTTTKNPGANFSHDLSKSCSTCDHLLASYKHIKLAKPLHIYSIFTVLYN